MIELSEVYRARPKCDRCGWIGSWRSSSVWIGHAEEKARADLLEHAAFWHPSSA